MGFNTVAFVLNDYMHYLEESPKTVAWLLAHPPMSEREGPHLHNLLRSLADEFNEPVLHFQALEILPTWHADGFKFLVAGHNTIAELKWIREGETRDGKRTVTLELPEWWNR